MLDDTPKRSDSPAPLSDEVCEQLALLDNSRNLILIIMAALALQVKATDIQRDMLLGAQCCPDPNQLRLGASAMVLYSLLGFQNQTVNLANKACLSGETPDTLEPTLGVIIILIALIRFFRLLEASNAAKANAIPTFAEEETLFDPVL